MSSNSPASGGAWRVLLALSWFGLVISVCGDEPKVTKNLDGGTTASERVSFGKDGIQSGPFVGTGEKRTTRDKDGNLTKIEWVKFGKKQEKLAMAVFVQSNPNTNRTTVTTYNYLKDGKTLQSKTDQVFSTKDGTMLYDRFQTYDSSGKNPATGVTYSFEGWEDGKTDVWKTQQRNPKTGEWENSEGMVSDPNSFPKLGAFLGDLQKKWGSAGLVLEGSPSPTRSPSPSSEKAPEKTLSLLLGQKTVALELAGTGATIGHIADCRIQNLTNQAVSFVIPAMVLESSSGKNQHYACPKEQMVQLGPNQSKTVPMDGVCLDRSKPPVGKGETGDLVINEGGPTQMAGSHLRPKDANEMLRLASSKYDAAEELQKEGKLKELPYHDKQKQKDIVIQWSVWSDPQICQITGSTPATKEDLQKVVYKQIEEKGPMKPETKKKVDEGIDTIFEKVELTSTKAKELEEPEEEELATGTTVNISNDTPTPGPGTKEKPKKDKKDKKGKKKKGYVYRFDWWDKFLKEYPFADWLEKKFKAGWTDQLKDEALDNYNEKFKEFLNQKKSYNDLKSQRDDAEKKAKAAGATGADKDAFKKLDNQLKKLENDFKQDFSKTDDGKSAMGNLRNAEKVAEKAHEAEREAGKNIDDASKEAVDNYLKDSPPPPELIHPPNPVQALW